jgi:ABC-type transporter Mla MlaB component
MTGSISRISIDEEMTIATVAKVNSKIMNQLADNDEVEVDLSLVDRIDTVGFQLMLMTKLEAVQMHKKLRFIRHSPAILDVLGQLNETSFLGDPLLLARQQNAISLHVA